MILTEEFERPFFSEDDRKMVGSSVHLDVQVEPKGFDGEIVKRRPEIDHGDRLSGAWRCRLNIQLLRGKREVLGFESCARAPVKTLPA